MDPARKNGHPGRKRRGYQAPLFHFWIVEARREAPRVAWATGSVRSVSSIRPRILGRIFGFEETEQPMETKQPTSFDVGFDARRQRVHEARIIIIGRAVGKFRRLATRRENLNQWQHGCPGLANFSIYLSRCGVLCDASRNRDLPTRVHSVHDVPYN